MPNTTATLYIRSKLEYRKPPRKLIDLPEMEHYQLFWYEGTKKKSKAVVTGRQLEHLTRNARSQPS